MEEPFTIFSAASTALAVRVRQPEGLLSALERLGLEPPRPVLVIVGGASGSSESGLAQLRPLFAESLVPLAQARAACVVDGGTDAGVMRLLGRTRTELGASFPLIGVVVEELATHPGGGAVNPDAAPLEPNHTHFLLVEGTSWGDESPWLAGAATALAGGGPSLTVLVGGGEIAWEDVAESVRAGRSVIAIAGSGRTADAVAAAARGAAGDERGRELARSPLVSSIDLDDRAGFERALEHALSRQA